MAIWALQNFRGSPATSEVFTRDSLQRATAAENCIFNHRCRSSCCNCFIVPALFVHIPHQGIRILQQRLEICSSSSSQTFGHLRVCPHQEPLRAQVIIQHFSAARTVVKLIPQQTQCSDTSVNTWHLQTCQKRSSSYKIFSNAKENASLNYLPN